MSARADRVAARLAGDDLDALLVTGLINVRYLTGFTGSNAMVVVGEGLRRFITDFRYVERAAGEVDAAFEREQAPQEFADALAAGWPPGPLRLGFEDQHLTVRQHARLREIVPERVELVAAGGLVEAERAVKEPAELERVRAAAALADEVYGHIMEAGLAGRTEREVALDAEHQMRLRGADDPSFATIVASGPHGALPHAEPRDVAIAAGTLVTIDMGARLDGYCSDCTRTFATGPLPSELTDIYELVERAQAAGLEAVRAGPTGREVDAVARDVIAAAEHAEHFGHGLGHGVGLEVHEAPRLSRACEDRLAAGNVVTVEPGVYVPGVGGVRIEDLVAVTETGCEIYSSVPKRLLTIG